jgi:hypothetical protein
MSSVRLSLAAIALVAVSVLAGSFSFSQEAKDKSKGRLPTYYADIVTEAQRQKIYDVQAKYAAKLAALKEEIETLETKRDNEVEAILDAQQKAKLKKAQGDAAAKRKKTAADKKGAENGKKSDKKD